MTGRRSARNARWPDRFSLPRPDEAWPRGRRSLAFDVLVAGVAMIAELSLLLNDGRSQSAPMSDLLPTIVLTVLACLPLPWRRRAPLAVLVGTFSITVGVVALDGSPGGVPVLVALFTTADLYERRVSLAALAPTAVLLSTLSIVSPPVSAIVWGLGAYQQTRRRYTGELRERAARLEREQEQLARIAIHEERASIARELHDIVAHSVTVMLLGVRGARDVLATAPEIAAATLDQVENSGEQSLTELRRILTLLRGTDHGGEDDGKNDANDSDGSRPRPADRRPTRPQPTLADLDDLVATHRTAGLPVSLVVAGEPQPLPGGLELSVYRIVQEALTNVQKHSRPARATVRLTFEASHLDVEVEDEGSPAAATAPATPKSRTGHGIVGMRERVTVLGGTLETGHRADGGFRVAARLPVGSGR